MVVRVSKPEERIGGRRWATTVLPTPRQDALVSEGARLQMVSRLRQQGIDDEQVLAAMRAVPRHLFVDQALASRAYEDSALPIGARQTISRPFVVARALMLIRKCSRAKLVGRGKILEVGTGCGYQAAVLAELFDHVYSMERIESLYTLAQRRLQGHGGNRIQLRHSDGHVGWPEHAPYDAILSAAASDVVPPDLLAQLAPGGVLLLPLGGAAQCLVTVVRTGLRSYERTAWDAVRFVPMLPGLA